LVPLTASISDAAAEESAASQETKISADTVLMVHPDVDVGF
jgi:hypothetical protein